MLGNGAIGRLNTEEDWTEIAKRGFIKKRETEFRNSKYREMYTRQSPDSRD